MILSGLRAGRDMKGDHCDTGVIAGCYTPGGSAESLLPHPALRLVCIAISILQQEALGVQEDAGIKPRSGCPVGSSISASERIIGGVSHEETLLSQFRYWYVRCCVLPGVCSPRFLAIPVALLPDEQLAERPGQCQLESLWGVLL